MNKYIKINIAEDFSDAPGARYILDGPDSGEAFYKKKLSPKFKEALKKQCVLLIDMDGTFGYATSFISESFGCLSKEFGSKIILANIEIKSNEDKQLKIYVENTIKNPENV